jgi:hypothetical protein
MGYYYECQFVMNSKLTYVLLSNDSLHVLKSLQLAKRVLLVLHLSHECTQMHINSTMQYLQWLALHVPLCYVGYGPRVVGHSQNMSPAPHFGILPTRGSGLTSYPLLSMRGNT